MAQRQFQNGNQGVRMIARLFASISIAVIFSALMVSSQIVIAQNPAAAVNTARPAKTYKAPRTSAGQPDLQGFWSNTTYAPLQRPNNVTKEFFTREELEEVVKRAATDEAEQTVPGTIPDVHYDFTQFGLDRSQGVLGLSLRTSMIVD